MSEHSLQTLANTVLQMRDAQKAYFKYIAEAKKSKLPSVFAVANNYLKASKQLENLVDDSVMEIMSQGGELIVSDKTKLILAQNVKLFEALLEAKKTIRSWHGGIHWDIYDSLSPEMNLINSAINNAVGGDV